MVTKKACRTQPVTAAPHGPSLHLRHQALAEAGLTIEETETGFSIYAEDPMPEETFQLLSEAGHRQNFGPGEIEELVETFVQISIWAAVKRASR